MSGLDYGRCRAAIPGARRAVEAAHAHGMWVVWVYWSNRPDLRNLGAPTLYAFKHRPDQKGIGEQLEKGRVLTEGTWNAAMVDELLPLMREEDVHVEKVRMNGFVGTHLDQVLRTQGVGTLYFAGVNIDQCVASTMEEACFRDARDLRGRVAVRRPAPGRRTGGCDEHRHAPRMRASRQRSVNQTFFERWWPDSRRFDAGRRRSRGASRGDGPMRGARPRGASCACGARRTRRRRSPVRRSDDGGGLLPRLRLRAAGGRVRDVESRLLPAAGRVQREAVLGILDDDGEVRRGAARRS